jgi:hypothetical protein
MRYRLPSQWRGESRMEGIRCEVIRALQKVYIGWRSSCVDGSWEDLVSAFLSEINRDSTS